MCKLKPLLEKWLSDAGELPRVGKAGDAEQRNIIQTITSVGMGHLNNIPATFDILITSRRFSGINGAINTPTHIGQS